MAAGTIPLEDPHILKKRTAIYSTKSRIAAFRKLPLTLVNVRTESSCFELAYSSGVKFEPLEKSMSVIGCEVAFEPLNTVSQWSFSSAEVRLRLAHQLHITIFNWQKGSWVYGRDIVLLPKVLRCAVPQ